MNEPQPGMKFVYQLVLVIANPCSPYGGGIDITRRYRTVFDAATAILRLRNDGCEIVDAQLTRQEVGEDEPTDGEAPEDEPADSQADLAH
jgi:hypothetical protein